MHWYHGTPLIATYHPAGAARNPGWKKPPGKMSSSSVEFSIQSPRDAYRDRRPPWSEDAEQAVLAAMLIDQDAIRVRRARDDTMFYREGHRRIFRAMVASPSWAMSSIRSPCPDELQRRGGSSRAVAGLHRLPRRRRSKRRRTWSTTPRSCARRRSCVASSRPRPRSSPRPSTHVQTAGELLDHAESRIFEISRSVDAKDSRASRAPLADHGAHRSAPAAASRSLACRAGPRLMIWTSGFQPSDLIVVAARPSMGKPAFILNLAATRGYRDNVSGCAVLAGNE